MEILTLDSNFRPVRLIENYQSCVWAERYSNAGDFQLVTGNIEETLNLMPLESYVTLRESTVPMVVEAYKIEKPLREAAKLTVVGRSFETVLERRASVFSLPGSYTERVAWLMAAKSSSDAAYKVIRAVIGDIARLVGATEVLAAIAPVVSALDAIPEINLPLPADYDSTSDDWVNFEVKTGRLYETVIELINLNHHGIKSVRPLTDEDTKVDIEIYNGADLTETVAFDARFDQFDDANYVLSKQGSANIAYVYGSNGSQSVRKNNVGDEVSGLERRVLPLDESSDTKLSTTEARTSRGLVELYKNNATALFDGETSVQVAAGFNNTYFLGDILKLVGEYGLSRNVRVAEFIRSSDNTGDKAYPTFEAIDE